jgi:hypothetical protein
MLVDTHCVISFDRKQFFIGGRAQKFFFKSPHFHIVASQQEFEITLVKQQGSLGFTLQKEDDSVLGHYVRALVREPATTDGRIKPGDKIIAVNDVPISKMTHEQAVIFLRQAPDTVRLRLYRHHNSTELPSPSSSASELNYKLHGYNDTVDGGCGSVSGTLKRSKLRPEAMSLISDLATRKNTQSSSNGNSQNSSFQSTANNSNTLSSPRRLRKNNAKSSNAHSGGDSDTTLAGEITFRL